MAFVKKSFNTEALDQARRLYDEGASLAVIAASLGIARSTLVARAQEWSWPPRELACPKATAAPAPRRRRRLKKRGQKPATARPSAADSPAHARTVRSPEKDAPDADAQTLADRVQRVVKRELDAIDHILGMLGAADAAEAERAARTLASLARALKEVMRLAAPDETNADAEDDDPVPRDLDEFRRELARRLAALNGGAADHAADAGE